MDVVEFSVTVTSLQDIFASAVRYFNAGKGKPTTDPNWTSLQALLDNRVIATAINKTVAYKGPGDVITYLQSAKATFTNDVITSTELFGTNYAVITGTAIWTDPDNDKDGPNLIFTFVFALRGADWKILKLTATYSK